MLWIRETYKFTAVIIGSFWYIFHESGIKLYELLFSDIVMLACLIDLLADLFWFHEWIWFDYRKSNKWIHSNKSSKSSKPSYFLNCWGSHKSFLIDEQSSRIRIRYMIILKLADIEVPNNECCEFIISLLSLG